MVLKKIVLGGALLSAIGVGVQAAETFTIDQSHSNVGFEIEHMMISDVDGEFKDFAGEIVWDDADLSKSMIKGTIKTASIDTDNQKRDDHLRNADFFDVQKHPQITFETKSIQKRGKGYVAQGTLTMKGVSKNIEIPFTVTNKIKDPWGNTRIGLDGEIKLNRKDFGLTWNKTMDAGGFVLGDEVEIELDVEAIQKAPEAMAAK